MELISLLSNFAEMIAALAALGVSYLMYREVMRLREKDRDDS